MSAPSRHDLGAWLGSLVTAMMVTGISPGDIKAVLGSIHDNFDKYEQAAYAARAGRGPDGGV